MWHNPYNINVGFIPVNRRSHSAIVFLWVPKIRAVARHPMPSPRNRNAAATLPIGVLMSCRYARSLREDLPTEAAHG